MKHLSREQISSLVAEIPIPEEMHARECAECAAEVEHIRSVLILFRDSLRERSACSEFSVRDVIDSRAVGSPGRAPMVWVFAAAVLAAIVAFPIYQASREQELRLQAQRDAQLLDDVNSQLSRSGPVAMDPLMRLMVEPDGGGGSASAGSGGVEPKTGNNGK